MESFSNPFLLAADFINRTNRSIFLTGKAGTGKTTFLRQIKEHTHKQTAVVAPTGVAAINAGGSTIHSFFQLPFYPYLPEKQADLETYAINGKNELISKVKMTNTRRKILQELELLIIDEISMVRCDTLDAIDVLLRHFRFRMNEPFGGVQVLLIGDMFQLSPVAVENEWRILSPYYQSPYFFHSRVMLQKPPVYIELDKIYRQNNHEFISLLNEVRNNKLSIAGLSLLQSRYQPDFVPPKNENYITLSTHNYIADQINSKELLDLPEESVFFKAIIKGEYPEKSYPLDENLELKTGAKVMFIKNDLDKEKRYYNGKIGVLKEISTDFVKIECAGEPELITVGKYVWENIRYEVNPATKQLDEKVTGTFQQLPLRLAWAITIHKSQGLTFEKAIIDAGKAFAAGQVYVALSRCTSLDGLILKSPINKQTLNSDLNIVQHSSTRPDIEETQVHLQQEKMLFQLQLLCSLFDFKNSSGQIVSLNSYVAANSGSFNPETIPYLSNLQLFIENIQVTAGKFQIQLQNLKSQLGQEDGHSKLHDRITAASDYFNAKISEIIHLLDHSPAVTDSKIQAQNYNDELKTIFSTLSQKQFLIIGLRSNFSVEEYFKVKSSFLVPAFHVNAYAGNNQSGKEVESKFPMLLRSLRALRNNICESKNLPVYLVAGSITLLELSNYLPLTMDDLSKISGFGPAKLQSYGQQFLEVIINYCSEHKLETKIHEKPAKKQRKTNRTEAREPKADTKFISFEQYKSGKTIAEIAALRNFTTGTIEGHLARYVVSGDISLTELVKPEKISLIENALNTYSEEGFTPLKQQLGDDISYGEIRLVAALWKSKKQN